MTTLTASEIARHIRRPKEPPTAAIDRFRNWTKMGILKPVGKSNPGTGRKKQYDGAALVQAVLLQALTDTVGSSAVSLRPVIAQISGSANIILTAAAHACIESPQSPKFIVLTRLHNRAELRAYMTDEDQLRVYVGDGGVHVVINIADLFGNLDLTQKERDAIREVADKILEQTEHKRSRPKSGK